MKKIIKVMIFIATFFIMSQNCYAIGIKVENQVPDIKVHIKTSTINDSKIMYEIKNKNTNELLYNLTLEDIESYYVYDYYDYYGGYNPFDTELKNKIAIIIYHGYGYKDRTNIKWYFATQYLIWEALVNEDDGEIYFEDNNGNKLNIYEEEIEAIRNDVKHYTDLPSFLEPSNIKPYYKLKLTEKLILEDSNKIIDNFEIKLNSTDIEAEISDNKVIITPLNSNLINVYFRKKLENLSNMKIFIGSGSKSLANRGMIEYSGTGIIIDVELPKFKIKSDSISKSKLTLENNKYVLCTEEDIELEKNIAIDKNGFSKEYSLFPGKYYLKQIETSYGYKLNDKKIYFNIERKDLILNVENELETKNVTIEHQLIKENNETVSKPNSKIDIYDEDNKLIEKVITDKVGKAYIKLSYGMYKLVQNGESKKLKDGINIKIDEMYDENKSIIIMEEMPIKIEENNENNHDSINSENNNTNIENKDEINHNFANNENNNEDNNNSTNGDNNAINNDSINSENNNGKIEVKGSIIVNKIDYLTGKPLKDIKYALFNNNKELVQEEISDSKGKLIFKDIATGKYYLKEILKDDDYNIDNSIEVEVKENIDSIITINNRIQIEVPNTIINKVNLKSIYCLILTLIGLFNLKDVKIKKEEVFN